MAGKARSNRHGRQGVTGRASKEELTQPASTLMPNRSQEDCIAGMESFSAAPGDGMAILKYSV